jgi:glycosyltransferase involved in cell wall biosynthesis
VRDALISCIVPVFNGERFLGEALDSILAQTYRPVELIVVDDGSTDATAQVAARYTRHVSYLRQEHSGSAAAKNNGLRAAQGDLIAFLDADDLWHADKLSRQRDRLLELPELTLCFTRFQNFWIPELAHEAERYRNDPMAAPLAAWSIGTLLVARAVFARLGPFREQLRGNENMLWFLHAAGQGATIEVLPEVLMRRRIHELNDCRRGWVHARDLFFPIIRAWRDYKGGSGVSG